MGEFLRIDSRSRRFDVEDVPPFAAGQRHSVSDLDRIATRFLWERGRGEYCMFLTYDEWANRCAPELLAKGDLRAPDPSYTRDRHRNSIEGMYWRTHPEGRQWRSLEGRRDGESFYRRRRVTEHESGGSFKSSPTPPIARSMTKGLSKYSEAMQEVERNRLPKEISSKGLKD